MNHLLLVHPAANRVYEQEAGRLMAAELAVADHARLGGRLGPVSEVELAGVAYLAFSTTGLDDLTLDVLGGLSASHALFARHDGDLLEPVLLPRSEVLDDDLATIPKYPGKTNELFTRLLVNVTAWCTDPPTTARPLRLLDPLCGRGTTLHQALLRGWHATGIDSDAGDFDAHTRFIKAWLRRKRLKHTTEVTRARRERETLGRRLSASIGPDAEAYRRGQVLELTHYQADTLRTADLVRAAGFDLVVADAPYGVRHGSRSGGRRDLDRSPAGLVAAAAPGWARALRPGGALGLSWNLTTATRHDMTTALVDAGLEPVDLPGDFEHRVDASIIRDLVVARRPAITPAGLGPGSG